MKLRTPWKRWVWALSILVLVACAVRPVSQTLNQPSNVRTESPKVVDSDGESSAGETEATVENLSKQSPNPEEFKKLLAITEDLSEAPLFKDNRAVLLIDGPETYRVMLKEIEDAESHIYLETYIFADDETGHRFADALIRKAAEGVVVRIIFDSIGSMGSDDDFFDRMEDSRIEIEEYNKINPIKGGNPLDSNVRNHRKLMVIDGRVAFTGGLNFSDTYQIDSSRSPGELNPMKGWRDTHLAIYGPSVAAFEKSFQTMWLDTEDDPVAWPELPDNPVDAGHDVIALLESEGGNNTVSPIYEGYINAFRTAGEKIWITQAYFAPDPELLDALTQAAARGVDVRILLPAFSDSDVILAASRSRYEELLESGVRIYEHDDALLHAKTAVVDGVWSTVGSSNIDYRSMLHNHEVNAVIFGKKFASQLEQQFERDIDSSNAIILSEWEQRPWPDKFKEFMSKTIEYWL